jgi:hypothetical protein
MLTLPPPSRLIALMSPRSFRIFENSYRLTPSAAGSSPSTATTTRRPCTSWPTANRGARMSANLYLVPVVCKSMGSARSASAIHGSPRRTSQPCPLIKLSNFCVSIEDEFTYPVMISFELRTMPRDGTLLAERDSTFPQEIAFPRQECVTFAGCVGRIGTKKPPLVATAHSSPAASADL